MPPISVVAMQRDEVDLLPVWLHYHGALAGYEAITLFDNGSSDPACLQTLHLAEELGVSVIRDCVGPGSFAAKGDFVAAMIRSLPASVAVAIPLDVDEFIGLRHHGGYTCSPHVLRSWFASLPPGLALTSCQRLNNCPWDPQTYWPMPPHRSPKLLFTTTDVWGLDLGYHRCDHPASYQSSDWVLFHYHNKPYPLMRDHALRKLLPRLSLPSSRALATYRGPGDHLLPPLLLSERQWLHQLRRQPSIYTSAFVKQLQHLRLPIPFAEHHARIQALLVP